MWLAGHRTDASQGHNWVSFKNPPTWGCMCFLKLENMDTHQYRCLGPKVCLVKGLKCAKTLYIYMYNATAKALITLMSTWQLHINVLSQHVFMFDFITANVRSTPSGFTAKIYTFAGLNILTLLFPVYTCFIPSKHEQSFPALFFFFDDAINGISEPTAAVLHSYWPRAWCWFGMKPHPPGHWDRDRGQGSHSVQSSLHKY